MPKYYCDYCDTYLTHDSPSVRKTHCSGRKHKENVKFYYQKWMEDQAQSLIDATIEAYKKGVMKNGAAIPPPGAMPPGMMMPGMPGMPMPGNRPPGPGGMQMMGPGGPMPMQMGPGGPPMGGPPMGGPQMMMGGPGGPRPPMGQMGGMGGPPMMGPGGPMNMMQFNPNMQHGGMRPGGPMGGGPGGMQGMPQGRPQMAPQAPGTQSAS